MHIMAANAYARGARTFGIAWETSYRFGKEGHDAFVGAVKRLGGTINADAPLASGQGSYGNQAQTFITDCGGVGSLSKCDFIAMLLEPATAQAWVSSGGLGDGKTRPRIGIGVPQPLFIDSFARNCAKYCSGMWAWTSFKPPLDPYAGDSAVSAYLKDLRDVASPDRVQEMASNPHVEGAYVGMSLLVDALTRLGAAPTRAGIKQVLDATTLDVGLGPILRFSAGNHFASVAAQAYYDTTQNDERGTFANWRYTNSGFIADREVGKDVSS
jgi:ABC-type branched-subunit amino acid transport system substrate-binding protein